ncbi:MAG: hypothetical protein H6702_06740 [Myxococcales bacterium]|nr:hypothetical protein [Myxococcales bacterium]
MKGRLTTLVALAAALTGCPAEPDFHTSDAAIPVDARVGQADEGVALDRGPRADLALPDQGGRDAAPPDPDDGVERDQAVVTDAAPPPDQAPPPDMAVVEGPAIVGDWVSEGADVAPLLSGAPGNLRRLDATFTAAGAFDVVAVNADGQQIVLTGRYQVDEGDRPPSIVLTQTEPYAATSEGIWQVQGDTLTYEVVETDPGLGATPPANGFGSTSNGQFGDDNIQIYRRVR